jgi:tRNA U34 5-carboxymethylaminomethyl modifying GTPase MnmE/TrmE
MDTLYQKLNKELDIQIKQTQTTHSNIKNTNTPPRLINLTNTTFTRQHIHTLALGPNYALEKDAKDYINELIVDTENAIRQLDHKIQNTFRYMVSTKIKQILTTSTHHTLHKRYPYNLNHIKSNLRKNNLTIAGADKNKAIVIINKDALEQKIMAFIPENHITHLNKHPMDLFQK